MLGLLPVLLASLEPRILEVRLDGEPVPVDSFESHMKLFSPGDPNGGGEGVGTGPLRFRPGCR